MLDDFHEEGRELTKSEIDSIYTPVGLDLGGETTFQVAHSIISEVLVVHNDRVPGHLKERNGPIHKRTSGDDE